MENKNAENLFISLLLILFGLSMVSTGISVGITIGKYDMKDQMQKDAVSRHVAHYEIDLDGKIKFEWNK